MRSGRGPIVALVSLGCPKNLVDSERMLAHLAEAGGVVGAPMDEADVIVVNTCGFVSAARAESLAVIREAVTLKAAGRARRVVVAGCLVNRDAERLYELAPGIDAIIGVNDRAAIVEAVVGQRRLSKVSPCPGGIGGDSPRFRLTPRHTAYLRISEGCSRRCTFCTIPALRGPFRSKPPEAVLAEARELVADGAVELNVIGQDTTAYGAGLAVRANLATLLRRLDRVDGVEWIRLLYAYPKGFTAALIDAMADCEHVVPYVDVPLQHVNDRLLRQMGRGVSRGAIERLVGRLRQRVAGLVLRTTFIVGFPGETDAEFEDLLAFVKAFRFDAAGVFEFSPEEGTPAAGMRPRVPPDVKAERRRQLMLAQQEIAFARSAAAVGSPVTVLVDGVDPSGRCVARHYGQAPDIDSVCLLTDERPPGTFVSGTVADYDGYDLVVEPRG